MCVRQDSLVSSSSFPVEFVNVEEILGQQLFSGLHIDNDVSDEEIVSCTITTSAVLGSDNLTSFWETQITVSENFVLSSNLSYPILQQLHSGAHRRREKTNIANTAVVAVLPSPIYVRGNFDYSRSIFDGTA
jgi:hypothetical protein